MLSAIKPSQIVCKQATCFLGPKILTESVQLKHGGYLGRSRHLRHAAGRLYGNVSWERASMQTCSSASRRSCGHVQDPKAGLRAACGIDVHCCDEPATAPSSRRSSSVSPDNQSKLQAAVARSVDAFRREVTRNAVQFAQASRISSIETGRFSPAGERIDGQDAIADASDAHEARMARFSPAVRPEWPCRRMFAVTLSQGPDIDP